MVAIDKTTFQLDIAPSPRIEVIRASKPSAEGCV